MPSARPELPLYFLLLQEGKLQYGICSRQHIEVHYSYPALLQDHFTFLVRNNKVNVRVIMFVVMNIVYYVFRVLLNVR